MSELRREVGALAALRERPRRLLAVFAHPDDESYACAGAFARAGGDAGAAAVLLCLTRGEAATVGRERGIAPEEMGRIREGRLEEVAEITGLDGLIIPGFPDRHLATVAQRALSHTIAETIAALRPQVVIGNDPRGANAHPDHIASHWALRRALEDTAGVRFAMVAYDQKIADLVAPRLLFPTPAEEIDVILALDEREADAKERCLRIHEAYTTLDRDHANLEHLRWRPPQEMFDLLGEKHSPPLADLFHAPPPPPGHFFGNPLA